MIKQNFSRFQILISKTNSLKKSNIKSQIINNKPNELELYKCKDNYICCLLINSY